MTRALEVVIGFLSDISNSMTSQVPWLSHPTRKPNLQVPLYYHFQPYLPALTPVLACHKPITCHIVQTSGAQLPVEGTKPGLG